jgi:two-component system nitrate/nitrite response regulator NarL
MDHEIVCKAQPLRLAQDASASVPTVLVCQNTLLRTGIIHILADSQFAVTGAEIGSSVKPSLILLCESLSVEAWIDTVQEMKAQYPNARLVALNDGLDLWAIQQLCRAGLDGVCSTSMSKVAMLEALDLVMLGELFLPASLSLALIDQASARKSQSATVGNAAGELPAKFSGREAQILRLLTKGSSNKLIARDLGLAEATVKVHIKAILRKAKAANRTQAAMWASQFLGPAANSPEMAPAG